MRWTKASEQLPDKERTVLIYCNGGYNVAWWWTNDPIIIEQYAHLELDDKPKWVTSRLFQEYQPPNMRSRQKDLLKEHYNDIYWMYLPEAPHPADDYIRSVIEADIKLLNRNLLANLNIQENLNEIPKD